MSKEEYIIEDLQAEIIMLKNTIEKERAYMLTKVECVLVPEYENSKYTWKQIKDAITS